MDNIADIQNKIYDFQVARAAKFDAELTPELVFLHLQEEIGEIARQLVNQKMPAFRKYDPENLKEEITQALLDLILLSKLFDIDLASAISKKIDNMRSRYPEA